jgi:glyoxalase family protein
VVGIHVLGIHHVTAICGDAQRNVDFYTGVLGLRLVKLTLSYEDPNCYHLYYGDANGTPGSLLTFFSKPRAPLGARGVGMFLSVTFAVPDGSLAFWRDRLEGHQPDIHSNCHGEKCLTAEDPDGLRLQFVERQRVNRNPWTKGGIPASAAILGIDCVTLGTRTPASKQFMPKTFGLTTRLESPMQSGNSLSRYDAGPAFLDVMPTEHRSFAGRGTIHHASFSVGDDASLKQWWQEFTDNGIAVSDLRDRIYYKSLYIREPGGALVSIATDRPGCSLDESDAELGSHLCIPESLMARKDEITRALPPLRLPVGIS